MCDAPQEEKSRALDLSQGDVAYFGQTSRRVICADTFQWLSGVPKVRGSVYTSLPDVSELREFCEKTHGNENKTGEYKEWFERTVELILSRVQEGEFAIFLQSDFRDITMSGNVLVWFDKSFLVSKVAERLGFTQMWHKIVICKSIDVVSVDRPQYSHLLCYAKSSFSYIKQSYQTPDVFDRGDMQWSKAVGLNCALVGMTFLKRFSQSQVIWDPFCGEGTLLATANALGMNSLGVDISRKRCKKALSLNVTDKVAALRVSLQRLLGVDPLLQQLIRNSRSPSRLATALTANSNLEVTILDGARIYMCGSNGRFVCAEPSGAVMCNRASSGGWATLTVCLHTAEDALSLRSAHGNKIIAGCLGGIVQLRQGDSAECFFSIKAIAATQFSFRHVKCYLNFVTYMESFVICLFFRSVRAGIYLYWKKGRPITVFQFNYVIYLF
jgi:hypothetical protein